MDLFRNLERSISQAVTDLFVTPPAGTLASSYYVYGEDEYMNDAFSPAFPYVFVLLSKVPPKQTRLPLVIVERGDVGLSPFEIGNRSGSYPIFHLHVFGRNRAERSALAAFLYENLAAFSLYDYGSDPPGLLYGVSIDQRLSTPQSVSPDMGLEGTLANWETVSIAFQLK